MTAELRINMDEQKEFIMKGFERIEKYYSLPFDKRESETGLTKPPHEFLLERSSKLIELGFNNFLDGKELNSETEWTGIDRHEFNYILIGIGTEMLLKAILLKEDPKSFMKMTHLNKHKEYQTPGFNKCKEWLIDFLKQILSSTHLERAKDILELIQLKRNNLVHLNFHNMSDYREEYQVSNLLRYLYTHFFEINPFNILEKLDTVKEKTKVTSGIDYESVEFKI